MTYPDGTAAAASDREQAYVRRWMSRHRPGGRTTPLLAARLAARYRGERIERGAAALVAGAARS